MDETQAVIRSQMDQTRTDLSEKLETLEQRVSDGLQATGSAVSDTLASVQGAMRSVTTALDFRLQVTRHPWLAVGCAVATGCLVAHVTRSGHGPSTTVTPVAGPQPLSGEPTVMQTGPIPPSQTLSLVRDLAVQALPLILGFFLQRVAPASPPPIEEDARATTIPLSMSSRANPDPLRTGRAL